tara:strand:- start:80 stop:289 length:210 start_codon:yes stop_codon:yes gene_type:complete
MFQTYEDWIVRPMTPQEKRELSNEEKKERKRLKKNISARKKYSENPEKFRERGRKWHQDNLILINKKLK